MPEKGSRRTQDTFPSPSSKRMTQALSAIKTVVQERRATMSVPIIKLAMDAALLVYVLAQGVPGDLAQTLFLMLKFALQGNRAAALVKASKLSLNLGAPPARIPPYKLSIKRTPLIHHLPTVQGSLTSAWG